MPVIGFLDTRSPDAMADRLRGFRRGLAETGYVEGDNVTILYRELQTASRTLGVSIEVLEVRSPDDFDHAFSTISQSRCDALIALQDGVTLKNRSRIIEFAEKNRLPGMYQIREFVESGGLMSYGLDYCQHFRRAAAYVDKVLKGVRPADLPVELPTTFELIVNLKTAKAIGLTIPESFLLRADKVIE